MQEFPLDWYRETLQDAGMKHTSAGFANMYGSQWVWRQLRDAHTHLNKCKHPGTTLGLRKDVRALEERFVREWGEKDQCFGLDFVIAAEWQTANPT